jgi:hypothetical protein
LESVLGGERFGSLAIRYAESPGLRSSADQRRESIAKFLCNSLLILRQRIDVANWGRLRGRLALVVAGLSALLASVCLFCGRLMATLLTERRLWLTLIFLFVCVSM